MLADLSKVKNKVVGTKQALKVINSGEAKMVYIAKDVDQPIKNEIIKATTENQIPLETVESKLKLGRACGIDVSAACTVLLK